MTDIREEARFVELMERLSDREWKSNEGIVEVEDMSESHIERVVSMIEDGAINLAGLEEEYIAMFKEELSDRDFGSLDFDN